MKDRDIGPFGYVDADDGVTYDLDEAGTAQCTIKLSLPIRQEQLSFP